MIEKAGDVFTSVAAFMDDPEQDIMLDGYIRPFLNIAQQRLFENVFMNPNVNGAHLSVVLSTVPAGTTTLSSYLQNGKELSLLAGIYSMREKPTGTPDDQYRPMRQAFDLPIGPPLTVSADSLGSFNGIYIPQMNDIVLPGANQDLDIRVMGEFRPQQVTDKDSILIPGTTQCLTHWTTEIIAVTRGAADIAAYHRAERMSALEAIFNEYILHSQEIPTQQRPYPIGMPGQGFSYFS